MNCRPEPKAQIVSRARRRGLDRLMEAIGREGRAVSHDQGEAVAVAVEHPHPPWPSEPGDWRLGGKGESRLESG